MISSDEESDLCLFFFEWGAMGGLDSVGNGSKFWLLDEIVKG